MTSDGKVTISTALDNSGLENGIQNVSGELGGLRNTLSKVTSAIGIAFTADKVIQFGKESVKAANELSDALTGLKSVLDGQGKSFSAARKFINEYTQDGLVPASNAITAYKNLALRGYDDSQIRQVMVALKDSATFGRQSSYSMGEAVESATEGLKNENSILVDNAGVTKNVAKMWEEYAASIGTTSNNLTQQQKIQAEVIGILAESQYQTGDAAKVAGTLSGQLMQLSFHFNNLKVAIGNAVTPILQNVLPIVNTAIAAFTKLANTIASVIGVLFGKASLKSSAPLAQQNSAVADSAAAGAKAEKDLADATKAAGKAAAKTLAPFDELTKLQENAGGGSGVGGNLGGAAVGGGMAAAAEVQVEDTISPKIQAIADKIRELLDPLRNIDFSKAVESFGQLREAVAPLTDKLFKGIEWAYYNIFVPLAEWTIEDFLPAFLDALAGAFEVLDAVLDTFQPMGEWLWGNFLQPIAEWTGDLIVTALEGLADALTGISDWISDNQSVVEGMTVVVAAFMAAWAGTELATFMINAGGVIAILSSWTAAIYANTVAKVLSKAEDIAIIALYAVDFVQSIGAAIFQIGVSTAAWIANTAAKIASTAAEWAQIAATTAWNAICLIATTVTTAFGAAVDFLTSPIGLVVLAIAALIAIIVLLVQNWDTVKETALRVWDAVKEAWGQVCNWFSEKVFNPLSQAMQRFRDSFIQVWSGIVGGVKGAINGVIGVINSMIASVTNGINALFRLLSFNIELPGGNSIGLQLPQFSPPQIPYLAKGAVIPPNREFMAVLGDQTHGNNIEAPEDLIRKIVREETGGHGDDQLAVLLEELIAVVCNIRVGDDVIGRAAQRYNRSSQRARGW